MKRVGEMTDFSGFEEFELTAEDACRTVFVRGSGPAVVVLHELPGMIPECVALAQRIADAGFTVFLPLLFGEPNQPLSLGKMAAYTVQLCLSREFYLLAKNQSSPITAWLKALCREAKSRCGDRGVGVIGMCLTGGFVLSLMTDESVLAPVLSQPSLPLGVMLGQKRALGISAEALAIAKTRAEKGCIPLGFRFTGDRLCPAERFARLREEFGPHIELTEIDSSPENSHQIQPNAHAVLTVSFVDQPGHPTRAALDRILETFRARL